MSLRRFLKYLLQAATAASFAAVSLAADPLVTNVSRFEIPFDLELPQGQSAEGFAVLFGSTDGGTTWEKLQSVPASAKGFPFAAPRDGRYAFAVRMTDAAGSLQPPLPGTTPELEILVDTVAPELQLQVEPSGADQAMIRWHSPDANAAAATLTLEYSDGADGRWQPVAIQPAQSGQTRVAVQPGTVLSVRASILDYAGNRGEASGQLVLPTGNVAVNLSPSLPDAAPASGVPLGPSPFGATGGSNAPSFTAASGPAAGAIDVPEIPQAAPVPTISQPVSTGGASVPTLPASTQPLLKPQLLSNRVFDLSYQVDDVGPSGVSAVELFVTEDGGQQWFRYGDDADLRSPMQVDVQGEGTFGFSVRVRNGLGFAEAPPQPGDVPDILIQVDQTPPQIQLDPPRVRPDGSGVLLMKWQVFESNPAPAPVRLEKSVSPTGPWTPVFDWQANQGGYEWVIQPGTPTSLFFRLLARDEAGNVASASTPQPVLIDLKRPVARLVGAQVSQSATATNRFE
jgi:hypothetical protein